MANNKKKLIVILGPNASGKTSLSIKLALSVAEGQTFKKLGIKGVEIISADSRQVYKGMDIGTGKITKKEMAGIPHHLLDVVSPKKIFDAAQYKKMADQALVKIFNKNKIPFLVGGTGFYIQAVTDGIVLPEVKPDWKLRQKLAKRPLTELYQLLLEKDPIRAKNIDKNNPRRIIRALEIVLKTGRQIQPIKAEKPYYEVLFLGVKRSKKEHKKLIEKRLLDRLENGMVEEVKKLHNPPPGGQGVSWKRLDEFGLEYRYLARYLQGKINYDNMVKLLQKEIEHYAKRQMTWFRKNKKIKWIKNLAEAEKKIKNFLK